MPQCFALYCPGRPTPGGANPAWNPVDCRHWGNPRTIPQGLIGFLRGVYDLGCRGQIGSAKEIYEQIYAPGSEDGNQFPVIGPDAATTMRYANKNRLIAGGDPYKKIYLNIHPNHIRRVFDQLLSVADSLGDAIHSMKRNTEAGAMRRPESIVIYTTSQPATDRVIYMLSQWLTRPPHQLRPEYFRPETPATAMAVHPGGRPLPGVSVAMDKSKSSSHGDHISKTVFRSVTYVQTQWPGGFARLTFPQFICGTFDFFREARIDPRRPWNLDKLD